jgi:hypothetical protein
MGQRGEGCWAAGREREVERAGPGRERAQGERKGFVKRRRRENFIQPYEREKKID